MKYLIFVIFLSIITIALWMTTGGSSGMKYPVSTFLGSSSKPLEGKIDENLLREIDSAYE